MDALISYTSTYLFVDVFCIVMAVVIIRKVGRSFGSELEIRYFKHMIGFYLLYCITDASLLPMQCGIVPLQTVVFALLSTINMLSMALASLFWFCFAQIRMHNAKIENRSLLVKSQLPILALIVLYCTNPVTGWMYTFTTDGGLVRGPLYLLAAVLTGGYILWVAVQALVHMKHAEDKAQRKEYQVYILFAVIPMISSILDPLFPDAPMMALCLLASIMFVFSSLQDARIFNDALTGLNNRRRADQYLSAKIAAASAEHAVYVYVLDINLFKRINDMCGHIEGDHALQVVAEGLRRAAGMSHGFAARWGGDEFVLVVDDKSADSPDSVVSIIDKCLKTASEEARLPYELSVSTGYAVCTSSGEDPEQLLSRADTMLYERKREAHLLVA